jgi:hypothetical protein
MHLIEEIEKLETAYCKASNALNEYREREGFIPGATVRCQTRMPGKAQEVKFGVIPPYGIHWSGRDGLHIPVLLDSGALQPWSMSDMMITGKAPETREG